MQKFGQATKAAQLLEIKQAVPVGHWPGLGLHTLGGALGLCSNTAVHPPPSVTPLAEAAAIHPQTLRREALREQTTAIKARPAPQYFRTCSVYSEELVKNS